MAAMSLVLRTAARAWVRQPLILSACLGRTALLGPSASRSGVIVSLRHASEAKKMFYIRASRFYDSRFLKLLNWYILLTGIPVLLVITFANVFIGQAELAEIPEGYVPEHWEYYKHPISRWIARYIQDPPEKEYEKEMARLYVEYEKKKLRQLEAEANHLMLERGDGPWHQDQVPGASMIDYAPKANPDF
ncbi:putative NADH dehydrogenase protein [Naja naja]|uniref:NADH dehydrogenase [ubiquinone] 1 beta subcomplex subunit 5, mitochondrial n=1 Tax=Naja naja TaxID=35670 RepID=A0A8C6XCM9_NAJNA|nr:putative NADH dehydrogenase protein [Naja naja]